MKTVYPPKLRDLLGNIYLDRSQAAQELNILDDLHKSIRPFIEPLLEKGVIGPFISDEDAMVCKYLGNQGISIGLGEFNSCTLTFKSVKVKDGVDHKVKGDIHAFVLKITVNGYEPTTLHLQVNTPFYKE